MDKEYQFRVIIAGAGVAGLTLANALEQAGIDYILLERGDKVAPRIGQSIAAEPNGSRILDQLGILKDWRPLAQPCKRWYERDSNGDVLFETDGLRLGGSARTGYDLEFGDRGDYLKTIYGNIKDKSRIFVNKNIVSVRPSETAVTVTCEDGSSYTADILAGADGVRSKVREEMWRLAGPTNAALVDNDRNALSAEYKCLFGIAESPSGPTPGDCDYGYDRDRSSLVFAGPHGKSYYFVFEKLNQVYRGNSIPRFTKDDAVTYAEKHLTMRIRPDLTLSDFWRHSNNQNLVCVEEGIFQLWTFGRIVCLGDSAHKMTPNIGAGGNSGIESAAALANTLKAIVESSHGQRPSTKTVEDCLRSFQKHRQKRVNAMIRSAGEITRMQAGKTLYHRIAARVTRILPGDFIADFLTEYFSDAEMLSFLPPPQASMGGLQPFNPMQGESQKESRLKRALLGLPFLVIFCFVMSAFNTVPPMKWLTPILETGIVSWENGSAPIRTSFYQIPQLDEIWTPINVFFTPSVYGYDSVSRTQVRTLLADFGVIIAIWAFESVRRANILTLARLPVVFLLLGQLLGSGVTSPIFYFFYYVSTPIEKFKASDMRLGRVNFAITLLPAIILMYHIPLFGMLDWPTLAGRELWLFFWQMFPVWTSLVTLLLSSIITDTTVTDRFDAPQRDLPIIRYTIGTLAAISSIVWIWTCTISSYDIVPLFLPDSLPAQATDFVAYARGVLQIDGLSILGSSLLWLAYLFWDLKAAGMIQTGWFRLSLYLIGSVMVLGPGATAGLGWLWREEVLASTRHQHAVTEASEARRNVGKVMIDGEK